MARPFINTPRGNESYHSDGFGDINDLAMEPSFVAPADHGLFKDVRNNARTPAASRGPLQLLPNGNRPQAKAEFTPMLRSVVKTNMSKRLQASARRPGLPNTPGIGLPRHDESHLASEHTNSSFGRQDETPVPQHMSSSIASTPLAQLPTRDGAVVNDGNVMTLREQEQIIDRIEKENFGLKMKIHFLEENLSKRGGDFNQAALKENTELKVVKFTMQRELHKYKKVINQAEKEAEQYKKQLEEYRDRVRQKRADDTFKLEFANLKTSMQERDEELASLQAKYDQLRAGGNEEVEKLRDQVEDLQADLRERDRQLDEREDEIDALKSNSNKGTNVNTELENELESARREVDELKEDLAKLKADAAEAKEERENAENEQRKAEEQLYDLQDEVANKSILPSGLSRQLEDRAAKFENEYNELKKKFQDLQNTLEDKSQAERQMQDKLKTAEKEGSSEVRHLRQQLEQAHQKVETTERKYNNIFQQLEASNKEMIIKTDEKDLLQTRHDALTTESAQLQKDLISTEKALKEMEQRLNEERQSSAQNESRNRIQHQYELDHLTEQIDSLHRAASDRDEQHAVESESWTTEKRSLTAAKMKADEKASGLQRTVDKLNDSQGTLSGREMRLQEALDSEKQRHSQEENVLNRQIEELNQDLTRKRTAAEGSRSELNNAREELRISIREQALLKEKITELEEEVEVLQADIEQEHDLVQQLQNKSAASSDSQITTLRKDKSDLQQSLASTKMELQSAKDSLVQIENQRDQLEVQLEKLQSPQDDTFDAQHERRELKRERQRLEKEVERLRGECNILAQTNKELEEELDAELEKAATEEQRLNTELDKLRSKHATASDSKELLSSKNKIHRLETRIRDLEDLLENQSQNPSSPGLDISRLQHDLTLARKNEEAATIREADVKATNRDLKMKNNDLERLLHEARLAELKAKSPASSVSSNRGRESSEMRQELFDARAELKTLRDENKRLQRASNAAKSGSSKQEATQAELNSKIDEMNSLEAKLSDQRDLVIVLQRDLARIRSERDEARHKTRRTSPDNSLDLRDELKRLRNERNDARNLTVQIAGQSKDAFALKSQLLRLREERGQANRRADIVEKELEMVQSRYETMLEQLTSRPSGNQSLAEKQIRGLIKEVLWLKAKCRREERLRKDLAWSKAYLENGESMRKQCNQIDLRILREMGVDLNGKKYEKPLKPIQKFRAGIHCVIAAIRISNMEEQWREARKIGDEISRARLQSKVSR